MRSVPEQPIAKKHSHLGAKVRYGVGVILRARSDSPDLVGNKIARSTANAGRIGFVPRLQSIRGILSFMVAADHACHSRWAENAALLPDPREATSLFWSALGGLQSAFSNGPGAVCFFFVLSGFVLSAAIDRGPRAAGPAAQRFFVRRLFRLFPAAITTVLIFAVVFWTWGLAMRRSEVR
jgi:peptidoglycan/LPS O-acetylase OafA/YrhL